MTTDVNKTPATVDNTPALLSKETAKILGKRLALALAVAIPVAIVTAVVRTAAEIKTADFMLDNE